jgi:uncharacterized protein
MRFILPVILLSLLGLLIDLYVYRNWWWFARWRPRLRKTLPVLKAGLWVMPFVLPTFFVISNTWEASPAFLQQVIIGIWAIWYLPKLPIAAFILLKDAGRGTMWLFAWFRSRLQSDAVDAAEPSSEPTDAGEEPVRDALDLIDMKHVSRREFLSHLGWSAATVPFVVVGYGVFRGLYDFDVRHVTVPIPGLPRQLHGLRIAQISDLHAGSLFSERPIEEAVDLILGERPDVIALTGDYVNNDPREAPVILPALDRLAAPLGVYGVLGNHDHYAGARRVRDLLGSTSVDVLVNDARTLQIDGARLHLVGTDNTGFGQNHADLGRALGRTSPDGDDAFVLLAHDPTFWDKQVRARAPQIDLTLSGHTHGGQLGIEIGPLRWSVASLVYPRWAGLYGEPGATGRQHLYVNRGLSTVGPPVRLGIPPEITILTLHRVSGEG